MGNTGIVRRIDDLGRIVIPAEMRHILGVREGDQLEITLEDDHIAIRPRLPRLVAQFKIDRKKRVALANETVVLEPGDYVIERIGRRR
ncbi:MAG TPA: AbrB/MazE/SpoVT family DNA-binding domain-containing protein [Acidimicrobiia bacterium]|nr:AbrB/MazE/SpoVT family DNA-binding domain-containing protein [Acidimicrobiia bacterium]